MIFYKSKNIFFVLLSLSIIYYLLFVTCYSAQAAIIDLWQNISECCHPNCGTSESSCPKEQCGTCTLNDSLQFGVNIAKTILQFLGVAALVAFIYGGIMWITSGGIPEKINAGKRTLTGAIIGIVIVVFAYVIVVNIMKWIMPEEEFKKYQPQAEEQKGCLETWSPCGDLPWTENCQLDPQKDPIVAMIQVKLNTRKCGNLVVDGCFGSGTRAAIKKFQTANSLEATGAMDQTTYNKLFGVANNCL